MADHKRPLLLGAQTFLASAFLCTRHRTLYFPGIDHLERTFFPFSARLYPGSYNN
jgi:hypothetical protein